jgi:hypothetical protein
LGLGEAINKFTDAPTPLGSWTGLPPLVGAPLSGALFGAGAGALYNGFQRWNGDPRSRRPKATKRQILLGALLGSGAGLASGLLQNSQPAVYAQAYENAQASKIASTGGDIVASLRSDPHLSAVDRQRILQALSGASPTQWSRLMLMASAGTLTGAIASRILGLGLVGTMLSAGAGALLAGNFFRGPKTFV